MNVRTLAQQDEVEPLGDEVSASRRQMQQWLKEKIARESCWVRVGVVPAMIAALAAVPAAVFAYLALRN